MNGRLPARTRRDQHARPVGPYGDQPEVAIADLEKILVWGRRSGEFRDFDTRTMAIAIRGAIDAIPAQISK
ncbi:hypothetical protein GCM10010404_08070 [Nonomuraea africana]|uniref:Uncharacterized protein n=3 Tax=Nonomuraea africana TaxID=46171 RepID=A0ABR9KKA1_9ACTN|nr:hypothetical protein [Nonomuraea africana]MBE1562447.1 hypothetical protein [Nonomuraea africana]